MKTRETKFEILRIIAMFFIVLSHYCLHSGFNLETITTYNKILLQFFALGNVGVDIFVVLSGYFYKSQKKTFEKIIKLECQMWFYMIGGLVVSTMLGITVICKATIIQSIFPILTDQYWFVTTYVLLLLVLPFMEKSLNPISLSKITPILVVLYSILYICPTITGKTIIESKLLEFIFLYLLGIFLCETKNRVWNNKINGILLVVVSFVMMLVTIIKKTNMQEESYLYVFERLDVLPLLLVIGFFIFFKNINIKNNKVINAISGTTLGIYFFHECPHYVVNLWQDLFNGKEYGNNPYMILHMFACAIIVFVVGFTINLFYQKLEKKIVEILTQNK